MSLNFTSSLDDGAFQATVKSMVRGAVAGADKIDRAFASIQTVPGFGALAGAFSGAAIGAAIKGSLDFAGALQDQSDALTVNVEKLQGIQGAFDQSGGSAEKVALALGTLKNNQQAALTGNVALKGSFDALGISMQNLREDSPDELLLKAADGFANATDKGEAYSAVLDVLGSKAGKTLAAGLAGGRAALEEQMAATVKLTKEEIASLDAAGDAWTRFGNTVKVRAAQATNAIADLYEEGPKNINDGPQAGNKLIPAAASLYFGYSGIETGAAGSGDIAQARKEKTARDNQKKWAALQKQFRQEDPDQADVLSSDEEAVWKARKVDLQKQVEDGNKLFLDGEDKKRSEKKKAVEAMSKLDEDLAKAQKEGLKKQIEDGNKLYLDDLEEKKKLKKESAKASADWLKESLNAANDRLDNARGRSREFDLMSPDERRQGRRDKLDRDRAESRRQRMASSSTVRDARSGSASVSKEIELAQKSLDKLSAAYAAALKEAVAK